MRLLQLLIVLAASACMWLHVDRAATATNIITCSRVQHGKSANPALLWLVATRRLICAQVFAFACSISLVLTETHTLLLSLEKSALW